MKTSDLAKFESYVAKGAHCANVAQMGIRQSLTIRHNNKCPDGHFIFMMRWSDVYFTDDMGTYHFTSNCAYAPLYYMDAVNDCMDGYQRGWAGAEETCLVESSDGETYTSWDGETCICGGNGGWQVSGTMITCEE